jgi:hypothetical protein
MNREFSELIQRVADRGSQVLFFLPFFIHCTGSRLTPEAEFLNVTGTFSSLLFTVASINGFYSPTLPLPLSNNGLKLVCNVNIVY